ncbi:MULTISPECIES: NUDIX hydrolase [Bacillus cereus group]|uniref:Phosphohydrolase (MutT/nudix family protein) n=1 Tax=Bacillus thuringiensis TaxID=1428 RepID=A0A1C4FBH3_BACTU|nr:MULTISPECIES: NUDIX hydrolase [Bacillus cereus group]MED3023089.1 NUDIX hydrolase [Bacillus wiedmannii]OTX93801.1 DNA mismatch repair protein MutT [Bacillus thuringiensis serovar wratislaviensis]OUB63845.1 DNA mismatch repair protein MutT [Bacillus thuringiensis serovar sylvestriensis]SCC53348.1 Phosphohydrolase (MutT/nudix family protein) [Bacillus thuringiensis]
MENVMQVRVTGILIEGEKVLLVKQKVANRNWSLPGGRVENGEMLEEAMIREMREETGLEVKIKKLLYVCDKPDASPSLLHITFLLERIEGEITLSSNEFDHNPIQDVQMVPIKDLSQYGFSETFITLISEGFASAGSYQGLKQNIGL